MPGDTVDKLTATLVKAITSAVVMVACGSRHTCVKLRGTNRMLCFGLNDFGQSSQATSAPSNVPITELRFLDNPGKEAFSSTIGAFLLCMIPRSLRLFDGHPRSHFFGISTHPLHQVLANSTVACTLAKIKRFGVSCTLITKVCLHYLLEFSWSSPMAVYCWGFNLFGELGDGSFISRRVERTILNWPSLVYDQTAIQVRDSGRGVRAVVSGHHNTCMLVNGNCNYGDLGCQATENSKCSSVVYSTLIFSFYLT